MISKKGQGISMTYIVIAALALVVLVVIVLFFTGGLQSIFKSQKDTVAGTTDQQLEIWRSQCKLYCSLGQEESWNNHEFKDSEGDIKKCEDLIGSWRSGCLDAQQTETERSLSEVP